MIIEDTDKEQFIPEDGLEAILNNIALCIARRDFATALELLDQLDTQDGEETPILIIRASILNSAGNTKEAKEIANSIIAKEPNNTEAMMILSDANAIEGNERERRRILEQIIKLDPHHVRALVDLGNLAIRARNLRTAAGYFDRALAADPVNGEALIGRANVHHYSGEFKQAEQLLDRAVHQYPQWARPLHERARLYKTGGFLNDALEDLNAAKKIAPDNYWIIFDRAVVLLDLKRKQEALEEFTLAAKLDSNNFIAYVYSAGIRDETGDYAGAEKDYLQVARLNPSYYFAFEGVGIIRMRDKRWAEARDAFLEAYNNQIKSGQAPNDYTYALLAAVCWMRAGKMTDPKQFLAQILRTASRDKLEYSMLRLFHDLNNDSDVAVKIDKEKNVQLKSRMLFYLAMYYDIRGITNSANRYFLMVQELDTPGTIEWRLNEMILEERGIGLKTKK